MQKAAIFIINSLSNGGAERVVINMANEMATSGKKVFIITVFTEVTYEVHKNIEIITLSKMRLKKLQKILKIPFLVHRLNQNIKYISKKYEIELITSHLIYSNLLTRLSKIRRKTIQVIHIAHQSYDKKFHFLFKKGLQFLYNHAQIVTVSKGCMGELLNKYQIKTNKITTIYNPIHIGEIKNKSRESITVKKPYILFVGRLSNEKRPEKMLDIFYQGKFYENYHLYFLGTGPLASTLEEKIKAYQLEDSVTLKGWCSNVYPYMSQASLLVNTSSSEAFPMILIEALACNCKIVAFDISYGPNEILVNDLKIYLAQNNNMEDMIDKINLALKTYPEDLVDRVSNLDVKIINETYIETYKNWNHKV